jgi:hypothetical protein
MTDTLKIGKRAFTIAVALATIFWSVGISALVLPLQANAASAGDLIRGETQSTVYYYASDGGRYAFTSEASYFTWYEDFDDVEWVSDDEIADISLLGNVVNRPGSFWIKIQSDPKTYAVGPMGEVHWIESEEVAEDLAGSDWNQFILDVSDSYFPDYTVGMSIMDATDAYDGALVDMDGTTYLVWGGEMRMVSDDGLDDNMYQSRFVLDGDGMDLGGLSAGVDLDSEESGLVDVAQLEEEVTGSVSGGLEVELSSATPAGASLPGGANSVEVLSVDLTAGDEDAELDSLTLSLSGAGATTNISNVYLYEGATRLTDARSVNASSRTSSFSNLGVAVEAGETRTLTVRVEVSASQTASDNFSFGIESADDVGASGDVSGDFPVDGSSFTLTGSDVGYLDIDRTGTVTNPTLGQDDAVVGYFKITTNTEDASMETVTLKMDNASDHGDYRLWDGSDEVATGEWISGDFVLFDLSAEPFVITEGNSNIFSVSADIGGQASDAVKVYVDNRADVVATGGDFGFGMCIDIGGTSCTSSTAVGTYNGADGTDSDSTICSSSTDNCSYSTVQGGDLTITSNGPSAGDIAVNSQDQTLLNLTVTAAQSLTIKDLDIIVVADDDGDNDPFDVVDDSSGAAQSDADGLINTTSGGEANLKDIKIMNTDTGGVVMGPLELDSVATSADDADQTIDFSDDFTMDAGETLHLAVMADVDNNITSGTEVGAILDISGLVVEDTNGDTLTSSSIVPSGDLQGYSQQARSASLTVALASTPGDLTSVDGSDNVTVVSFSLVAGEASDVAISSVTVDVASDEDGSGSFDKGDQTGLDVNDFVESCSIYDNTGTLLDGPEAPTSNGETIIFSNADWTVAAGETENLKVACNFANPSDGTDSNFFTFDLDDASEDVVAEDEDGTDVDPTNDAVNCGGTASSTLCTTPANVVTLAANGSLSVAAAGSSPTTGFIATSSSEVHVATVEFTATNEDFEVQTISFSEEQAEDDTGTANSSSYANNISLVTLKYPKSDGTTATKTAVMSGNEVRFADLSLMVEVGSEVQVKAYVDVPLTGRDSGGSATSNEKVRLGLFVDTTNDDNLKAVGVGSGTTLDDDDVGAVGDDAYTTDGIATFVVRETVPTVSLASGSPSGAAAPGLQEVVRFNVAASSNEDVVLEHVTFKVTATDSASTPTTWENCDTDATASTVLGPEDFSIFNLSKDASTALDTADADWISWQDDAEACTTTSTELGFMTVEFPTVEIVPAGSTYTYSVKADTTGASATADDVFRMDIVADPILSTYEVPATDSQLQEDNLAATDTTLTVSAAASFWLGDVLCMDTADDGCGSTDEKMLLTSCTDAGADMACDAATSITVLRGYLGTTPDTTSANDTNDDIDRLPSSLRWQDDGTSAAGTTTETRWGSYLVDSLDVTGGNLVF